MKRIIDARPYVDSFLRLIDSNRIHLIRPDKEIIIDAYRLAALKRTSFYDMIFVILAKELKIELKTFDKEQKKLFADTSF